MKRRLHLLLVALLMLSTRTIFAQSEVCGVFTLELNDSYGDGWNGNEIDLSFTGGDSTYTFTLGSQATFTLTVPYQDTVEFIWQAGGSYTSECSYRILDASGTAVYSSPQGNAMTAGSSQYYLYCNTLTTCASPTGVAVTTGTTHAGMSWTSGASSYSYHLVEWDTAGFAAGTGDTMWVYADTAYITGLNPATQYDFKVTTICSSTDSSQTMGVSGVYTQCAARATPWLEDMESTSSGSSTNPSLPQCWEYYKSGTNTYSTYQYTYSSSSSPGNSGATSLYMNSSSSSLYIGDSSVSMTPEIQGLDSATKMIEFYARAGSSFYDGEFYLTFANANGDANSIRVIDTIQLNSTSWEKYTVYLDGAQTGDARVGFMMICDGSYDYLYFDDFNVLDIPPCPEPIAFSLTSATRTSATLAWSSSSAAFDIEVGPMGFVQGTGTAYTSSTNSLTATGLMANTYYDVYVRSNCTSTGDGTSSYVGPFTFKTECGWFASPLTETFGYSDGTGSSANPDLPDCWAHQNRSTYQFNYCYVDKDYSNGNEATDSAYIYLRSYYSQYSSQTALGDTNAVILPLMTDLTSNDKQILFNARAASTSASYNAMIAVGTVDSTGDLNTLTLIDTVEFVGTSYADYQLDLDAVPANGARVALVAFAMANSGYTFGYNQCYIDEVIIRPRPLCPEVYDVVATATSDTSAVITWGDSSVVDEYLIDWGLAGFTQGTGTYDTIVGTTWTNNMMMDGETYEFYFQSVCSAMGVNSPWFGPVSLEMPCSPTTMPFADGFENTPSQYGNSTNPNLPDCWTYSVNSNPGNSYSYATYSSFSSYSGTGYTYNRMSNVAGDTVVVSLPMIENLASDGAVVKFWARGFGGSYLGQMAVGASNAMGDYQSVDVAQNLYVTNTTYQQYSVYLDSNVMSSDAQRPALMYYSLSGSYNYIYLDNVEVEPLPSCVAYNFMENNVTDTSADLGWMYAGNNSFNLEYGPSGFIQGTGTLAGTLVSSVTSPYTLSGLSPNTTYDYYVENACNPGTWYGPFTFTTECTGPLAAGTYTVGATGDFATLDSVMGVLNVCGIGGAVTFEFQAGSYSTSQPIGEINGSSMTNTITFKGGAGADTISAGSDAAFVLDGAKYMTFEDLFIYAPGSKGFRLNGTEGITIDGNTIDVGTTTSSLSNGIVASSSSTTIYATTAGEKDLVISNNDINGGYFAIRLYGSSTGRNENVSITGNTVMNTYYYGIYVYYGTDVTISENDLSGFGSNFAYGIYPYQIDGAVIDANHVQDVYYGVYAYYVSTTSAATQSSEITNNMIDAGYYGLGVLYSDSIGVYHNTARGNYAGVRDYYNQDRVKFVNNIFVGGTYALYNYNTQAFGDYNLYHSTGTYLGYHYVSSPYAFNYIDSIGELQSLDSTMHMSSLAGDPIFVDSADLHVIGVLANDAGDNSVGISVDIDGDLRPSLASTTVDIGADEFDLQCLTMVGASPDLDVCQSDDNFIWIEVLGDNVQYVWYQDGQMLSNSNNDTLMLPNAQFDSEFKAVASASCIIGGQTITTTDSLTIQMNSKALTEIDLASSLLEVVCEGETVDFGFGVTGEQLLFAWTHDGVSVGTDSLLSITSADTSSSGYYKLIASGTCGTDTSQSVQLIVHPETRVLSAVSDTAICQDASISVPVTTDGFNVTYKWYQDGSLVSTTSSLSITNAMSSDNGEYVLALDGYCGTDSLDAFDVLIMPNTEVMAAFGDTILCLDDAHTLAVIDTGFMNTYQWYKNGALISGETDSTLSLSAIAATDTGSYTLVATGSCGTDTSQSVQLIVHPETRVLSAVSDTAICQDASISVPVTTDGFNVTYKWYQDGSLVSTTSSLSITNAMSSDNGEYVLALDGYCGTDSLDAFDVLIMPNTEVMAAFGDTIMCLDDAHTLAVIDTGFMNTYQWYKNGALISGETDSTLSLSAIAATDTGSYTLVATGSCGTDSSTVIQLGAWQSTTMLSESNSFDICKGDQATMFLEANGDFLTYSWTKDGFALPGSMDDTLILNNVQPAFAGYFIGTATGICGTVSTDSIAMSVHQVPNIVQEPVADTLCQFDSTALMVNATGFGVTYNWYFNGSMVGSGNTLNLDSITYAQQGDYLAVADGFCGIDSSQMAYVKVNAILPVTSAPALSFEICELDTVALNASSLLGQTVNVDWYRDSVFVTTGSNFNLTDSGMYHVVLTDLNTGCTESTPQIEVIERPVPKPIQIFGEDTLANSNPEWYWVQHESNVDYSWSMPTGVVTAGWFSDSVEIKFSGSGTHMIYMQAENQYECTTNLELMVVVSGIGIYEGQNVTWNLYPNPTLGWTVLEFQEALPINVTMNIVDIKGSVVSSKEIEKGAIDYKLDFTSLEGGQYLIVIPELGMNIPVVKAD